MKEYLEFVRELADLIEEIGYENALNSVEYQFKSKDWKKYRHSYSPPGYSEEFTYRIKRYN